MCRYCDSSLLKCLICLFVVLGTGAIEESTEFKVHINRLEHMIQLNNDKLLEMEANWALARSGKGSSAGPEACEVHLAEQNSKLEICRAQAVATSEKLQDSDHRASTLLHNLTICQISLAGQQEQSELSDLTLQLSAKEEEILELQAHSKEQLLELKELKERLRAYEAELKEFLPQSCLPFGSTTGLYRVKLTGMEPFLVPCDARYAGSGWLVIQRRMDGSVDFFRNWSEYRVGFGELSGEFFIGLEKLHRLTAQQPCELMVVLEDFEGEVRYAHYDNFSVGSEATAYQLISLGSYDGDAGNSMARSALQKFSTADNDNDGWLEGNCARRYNSAWWYASCSAFCNLNGRYFKQRQLNRQTRGKGIIWNHWHGFEEALKFVQMMVRPISNTSYANTQPM